MSSGQWDARPTATFPAVEHHCAVIGTNMLMLLGYRGTMCVNNLPLRLLHGSGTAEIQTRDS